MYAVDLRTIDLDVASQMSVNAAIAKIISDNHRLDVVIHNAGHMVTDRPRHLRRSNLLNSTIPMS